MTTREDIAAMSEAELAKFATECMREWPDFTAYIDEHGRFGLIADWSLAELSPAARAGLTFVGDWAAARRPRIH